VRNLRDGRSKASNSIEIDVGETARIILEITLTKRKRCWVCSSTLDEVADGKWICPRCGFKLEETWIEGD